MEPEGDKSVNPSSTAAHFHPQLSSTVFLLKADLGHLIFQQRSLWVSKLTCLNFQDSPAVNTHSLMAHAVPSPCPSPREGPECRASQPRQFLS